MVMKGRGAWGRRKVTTTVREASPYCQKRGTLLSGLKKPGQKAVKECREKEKNTDERQVLRMTGRFLSRSVLRW